MHKHPESSKLIIVIRFSSSVAQAFVFLFVPVTYVINFAIICLCEIPSDMHYFTCK